LKSVGPNATLVEDDIEAVTVVHDVTDEKAPPDDEREDSG